ncbi:MAG TPA: hypothetical protein VH372_14690 [Actinospica sp.]|nr:hypothetical protein [Actinospica sp.]
MALAVFICLVLASVAALLVTDRRRKRKEEQAEPSERKDASALDYVNTFISTLYMILLALVVVVQWQNVDQINSDVRNEASTLTALVQTAQRMPGPEGITVRDSAVDYAKGVLGQEWPPKEATMADDAAAAALDAGQGAVTRPVALDASLGTIEDQAIGQYQTLSQARADRLATSLAQTSPLLMIALGVLSFITLVTPLMLGLRADAIAFGGLALTAALVCLSFWFVLDLNTLFHGLIHADSGPLSRFLAAPGAN